MARVDAYDLMKLDEGHYTDLGAVSSGGVTIDYYASPATLRWSNASMKSMHDAFVNADLQFQGTTKAVAKLLRPVIGLARMVNIDITENDLERLVQMPFPVAGPAMLLEVAFGARKVDDFFIGYLQTVSRLLVADAVILGVVAAACAATGVGLTAVPVLAAAGGVAGVVGAILGNLAVGKAPTRAEFGQMMKSSAQLAGRAAPTESQIDAAYAAINNAFKSAGIESPDKAAQRVKMEAFFLETLNKPMGPWTTSGVLALGAWGGLGDVFALEKAKFSKEIAQAKAAGTAPTTKAQMAEFWRGRSSSLINVDELLKRSGFAPKRSLPATTFDPVRSASDGDRVEPDLVTSADDDVAPATLPVQGTSPLVYAGAAVGIAALVYLATRR